MHSLFSLLASLGVFLIPIVAILMGGIIGVVKLILNHQERIALIERGIAPPPKN